MDAVQVWSILARLASSEDIDIGRLARRALSVPLPPSVDDIAAPAVAVADAGLRRPGEASTHAASPAPTAASGPATGFQPAPIRPYTPRQGWSGRGGHDERR